MSFDYSTQPPDSEKVKQRAKKIYTRTWLSVYCGLAVGSSLLLALSHLFPPGSSSGFIGGCSILFMMLANMAATRACRRAGVSQESRHSEVIERRFSALSEGSACLRTGTRRQAVGARESRGDRAQGCADKAAPRAVARCGILHLLHQPQRSGKPDPREPRAQGPRWNAAAEHLCARAAGRPTAASHTLLPARAGVGREFSGGQSIIIGA